MDFANDRALMLHEYGHAVFYANLKQYSEDFRRYEERVVAFRLGPKCPAYLGEQPFIEETLRVDPSAHPLVEKAYGEIILSSKPHQELFADLLAVVEMNDPNAMPNVLHEILRSAGRSSNRKYRNFRGSVFDASWSEVDEHNALDPARIFIWEHYFTKITDARARAALLRKVYGILVQDLMAHLHESRASAKINVDLMNRLRAELN